MAQQTLNNNELGSVFRGKLNDNFTELYTADTTAAHVDAANTWTASQSGNTQIATLTGSQTLDFSTYNNFVITLSGNITLDNPTTEVVGQSGFICFIQDATGSRTLTLGTDFLSPGGLDPVLTTTANAIDVIGYCVVGSGQILLGSALLEFS